MSNLIFIKNFDLYQKSEIIFCKTVELNLNLILCFNPDHGLYSISLFVLVIYTNGNNGDPAGVRLNSNGRKSKLKFLKCSLKARYLSLALIKTLT